MVERNSLVDFLDNLLTTHGIPGDKSANGLQVEGAAEVRRVIGAVDACLQTYEAVIQNEGDFLFVHHGEFWGGITSIRGRQAQRFGTLLRHGISLYAAHLPLDAHPRLGHNARIADMLGLREPRTFAEYAGAEIGVYGDLPEPMRIEAFVELVDARLTTSSQHWDFAGRPIRRIGVVSGGGASCLADCPALGIDCLLTGEINHTAYHVMRELGMSALAAGHYRTEVPGVVAVLDEISRSFDLPCEFVDIPTGL